MSGSKPALVPPASFAAKMAATADRLRSNGRRAGLAGDPMGDLVESLADYLEALVGIVAELRQQPIPISKADMQRAFAAALREAVVSYFRHGVRWGTVGTIALAMALVGGAGWVVRGYANPTVVVATGQSCSP